MGVLGVVLMIIGNLTAVASVNGRLPLVIAALFGQGMPKSPSYNSLQQAPSASPTDWTTGNIAQGAGDPSVWSYQ